MRDSANDAFFTAESLENLSEALVREGIQNCLDAANRDSTGLRQVSVNIRFVPSASLEVRRYMENSFSSARQNFERGLGYGDLRSLFAANCGYLVFEDFGTKGLTGDVNEWRLERAGQNAFFSFFRAEGRSSKTGENLGRWGIGKQVFPTASRLHAMFGLTVRDDTPRRVLMGSAVVKTHSVGEDDFQPDAWFGWRESGGDPVIPIGDENVINTFAQTFDLKRGDAPGLSIVVPVVDERVDGTDLKRGIVRSFFWPILLGELSVDLETPSGAWRIDADTLPSHRDILPVAEASVVEFAAWASTAKPSEIIVLSSDSAKRPDWKTMGPQLLTEGKINEIRASLDSNQKVGVRVPVLVRPKGDDRQEALSYFTVYIASCRDSGFRPIFLRDGIVITDVRCPALSSSRSLVVIDHAPLAGLLGDAEGVNHTQWQKDSPKFHNRYVNGPDTIKFVARSVYEILQRLHAADTKGDPSLLLEFFYLPTDEGDDLPIKKGEKKKDGPTVPPTPPIPPPPPQPKVFILDSVKGGFVLRQGPLPPAKYPIRIRLEAGYGVRRGNPIKRWTADDFSFIRAPIRQDEARGVTVTRQDGNILELEIRKGDFQFAVSGFDTKRDLVVRAIELKGEDETDV